MCTIKVNCISIYSNYVISRVVNEYDFIAEQFHYRITAVFYNTEGPLSHINLRSHNTIFLLFSNTQLRPFAIAFELLLKVNGALLEISDGHVNAADFVVICE